MGGTERNRSPDGSTRWLNGGMRVALDAECAVQVLPRPVGRRRSHTALAASFARSVDSVYRIACPTTGSTTAPSSFPPIPPGRL